MKMTVPGVVAESQLILTNLPNEPIYSSGATYTTDVDIVRGSDENRYIYIGTTGTSHDDPTDKGQTDWTLLGPKNRTAAFDLQQGVEQERVVETVSTKADKVVLLFSVPDRVHTIALLGLAATTVTVDTFADVSLSASNDVWSPDETYVNGSTVIGPDFRRYTFGGTSSTPGIDVPGIDAPSEWVSFGDPVDIDADSGVFSAGGSSWRPISTFTNAIGVLRPKTTFWDYLYAPAFPQTAYVIEDMNLSPGSVIRVIVDEPAGTAEIGACVAGPTIQLGATLIGAKWSSQSFSFAENDGLKVTLLRLNPGDEFNGDLYVQPDDAVYIRRAIQEADGRARFFRVSNNFEQFDIYATPDDPELTAQANGHSFLMLRLRGV